MLNHVGGRFRTDGISLGTALGSGLAWAYLLIESSRGTASLCLSGGSVELFATSIVFAARSGLLQSEALHWLLMVTAMMLPLLVAPIRHVAARSYRWRRGRAIAGFLAGYGAVWIFAGVGSVTLLVLLAVSGLLISSLAGVFALLTAAAWQISPFRNAAMRRCHRSVALAPRGWAADRDCIAFGLSHGLNCINGCLPLMLATMIAFTSVVSAAALASLLYLERGYQRSYRLVPALLLVGASFMLAVPALN